jgi:nucleolar GTP-binding protein
VPSPWEGLPEPPTAEELVDRAFSRAARAGGAKSGIEAQESMLRTAANVAGGELERVERSWPDFDALHPFHRSLAGAIVDVDAVRESLGGVGGAARTVSDLQAEYAPRLSGDADTARKHRKQAFARIADVVESAAADLDRLREARAALDRVPDLRPEEPTIVVAGHPNVGKTAFVNAVTNARNETASYPFTTEGVRVGHVERDRARYQLVDTPGLLDRPPGERNATERQAVEALTHLADAVLVLVDPTGTCGYPRDAQRALRDAVAERFDAPVLTVRSKADLVASDPSADDTLDPDLSISVETGDGLDAAIDAAVDAIGYEPPLPGE